ncbi:MAG: cell division protein CrgA [Nesterenkonia sp.]|uniref:cell division protein CrgA n=1 Tax=Nesterenkonia marinintestina TaxID=2979865 RepID=UPI0021BED22E|nr:cell division protein CrgA [Nesterenkonia sp. GX14115]MDO5493744.1 cell division protein CrgA [Nesterenkonia sp.]
MPESKKRRNRGGRGSAPQNDAVERSSSPFRAEPEVEHLEFEDEGLPTWYRVTMIGLLILGLLWLVVWYITDGLLPLAVAGNWNVAIGFGISMTGFMMMMRWQ